MAALYAGTTARTARLAFGLIALVFAILFAAAHAAGRRRVVQSERNFTNFYICACSLI